MRITHIVHRKKYSKHRWNGLVPYHCDSNKLNLYFTESVQLAKSTKYGIGYLVRHKFNHQTEWFVMSEGNEAILEIMYAQQQEKKNEHGIDVLHMEEEARSRPVE